jgi:hypothetical protein
MIESSTHNARFDELTQILVNPAFAFPKTVEIF